MIKSLSVKQNVTFAGTNALPRYTSSVGYADSCLAAARSGAVLGLHRRPIHCRAPASQPSRGRLSQRDAVTKSLSPNQNPPENPSKKSFPHPANPYSTVLYRSVNIIAPTFPQISPHNRRAVDNFCCVHRFSTSNDRMQIRKYPRKPLF